jgi:8-oxo-dGTP pyrophosphatase MutT (NUDIX family)
MKRYRKAIFAVTYKIENKKIKYIILKRKLHWTGWEFPKGGIGFLETKKNCIKREIKEEIGLKIKKIKKFKIHGKYPYPRELPDRKGIIGQTFSLFAVEVEDGKIVFDKHEHSTYKWETYNEAIKKLTWKNQKECLKKVNDWLKNGI